MVELSQGRYQQARDYHQQARDYHQQALTLCRQTGNRSAEAEALNGLGAVLRAEGEASHAIQHHCDALGVASEIGDQYEQARAHDGIGHGYQASGEPGQATAHWQEAVSLFSALGSPEADQVRARITASAAERLKLECDSGILQKGAESTGRSSQCSTW